MYSVQELAALYGSDYYAYQDNFQRNSLKEFIRTILCYRIGTRDPHFSVPGRMLDLGCGSGWFMSGMRDRGWNTCGVEINTAAANLGREAAGLNIFAGTLSEAGFPSSYFDYVRSNHSFEHLTCPGDTLTEIYRVLRPDGKLLIGVPNVAGMNAKIFGEYWWYLGAPVHPFTYSVETLSRLLRKHCFAIEKVTYNSDYSGILGSFQIWMNRANGRKSSEGTAINSTVLRLACQWMAKVADVFHSGDAIEIIATKGSQR